MAYRSLKRFLAETELLLQLTLFQVQFYDTALAKLGAGLSKNHSLSILRFSCCRLPTEALDKLAVALCAQETVEVLELVNCGLRDDCATPVKSIVTSHARRRNEQHWIHGLRGTETQEGPKRGLLHLNLSGNSLGDSFVAHFVSIFNFDQYLRVRISHGKLRIEVGPGG